MWNTLLYLFLVMQHAYACFVDDPIITTSTIKGIQGVDDVFYVLANTRPTIICEVNVTSENFDTQVDMQWILNGELQNSSTSRRKNSTQETLYIYNAGISFHRNELQCIANLENVCMKKTTVFVEVAKPVTIVNAYFGPNKTNSITAKVGEEFETYCTADGEPEPEFIWLSKYPGSTLWNEVGFHKNFTEIVTEEELPGPTFYRCQASNFANRDTNAISSQFLELNRIDVIVEPKWIVSIKNLLEPLSNKSKETEDVSDSHTLWIVIVTTGSILGIVGIGCYIFLRKKHSATTSSKKVQPMRPFVPSVQTPESEIYSAAYSVDGRFDNNSYLKVISDKDLYGNYLVPISSSKFLPLPNIPGEIPQQTAQIHIDKDDYHMYSEIPVYENDINNLENGENTLTTVPDDES